MVLEKGLEPLCFTAADFEAAVYTNSTTQAENGARGGTRTLME